MSLVISLIIPDGIVIAADSMSTQMQQFGFKAEVKAKCPNCSKEVPVQIPFPPIIFPSSTKPFAQKITSLKTKDGYYSLGIGTFGEAFLNNKTVYYHLRQLNKDDAFVNIGDAVDKISKYFQDQLKIHLGDLSKLKEDNYPLGFLLVGYEDDSPTIFRIHIGQKNQIESKKGPRCAFGGEGFLVNKIWELQKSNPPLSVNYSSFSLQDAIDYAEFLIDSTSRFLRFSNVIPTVGGQIDVALITKYGGFKWVKCKEITNILEEDKKKEEIK